MMHMCACQSMDGYELPLLICDGVVVISGISCAKAFRLSSTNEPRTYIGPRTDQAQDRGPSRTYNSYENVHVNAPSYTQKNVENTFSRSE